jgi:hypothetical protein
LLVARRPFYYVTEDRAYTTTNLPVGWVPFQVVHPATRAMDDQYERVVVDFTLTYRSPAPATNDTWFANSWARVVVGFDADGVGFDSDVGDGDARTLGWKSAPLRVYSIPGSTRTTYRFQFEDGPLILHTARNGNGVAFPALAINVFAGDQQGVLDALGETGGVREVQCNSRVVWGSFSP